MPCLVLSASTIIGQLNIVHYLVHYSAMQETKKSIADPRAAKKNKQNHNGPSLLN